MPKKYRHLENLELFNNKLNRLHLRYCYYKIWSIFFL